MPSVGLVAGVGHPRHRPHRAAEGSRSALSPRVTFGITAPSDDFRPLAGTGFRRRTLPSTPTACRRNADKLLALAAGNARRISGLAFSAAPSCGSSPSREHVPPGDFVHRFRSCSEGNRCTKPGRSIRSREWTIPHEGAAEKAKRVVRRRSPVRGRCSLSAIAAPIRRRASWRAQGFPCSGEPRATVRRRRDAEGHARRKSRAGAFGSAVPAVAQVAEPGDRPDGRRKAKGGQA
jgi:hypothetical protein